MIITKQKKQKRWFEPCSRHSSNNVFCLVGASLFVIFNYIFPMNNFESIMNKNNNKLTRRTKKNST